MEKQLSKNGAQALFDSQFWIEMSQRDIAEFQLWQERLCMPFNVFHEAITNALGRPVYTHEFGLNWEGLKKEFLGELPTPTLQDIIELIPEEKRIIIKL